MAGKTPLECHLVWVKYSDLRGHLNSWLELDLEVIWSDYSGKIVEQVNQLAKTSQNDKI